MSRLGRLLILVVAALGLGALAIAVSVYKQQSRVEYETTHFNAWALHKATNEINQFLQHLALLAFTSDGTSEAEVRLRLDILHNRVDTLATGRIGAYIARDQDRTRMVRELAELVADIDGHANDLKNPETAGRYISRLVPYDKALARAAAEAFVVDNERTSQNWLELRQLQWKFWAVVACLACSGAMLAVITIRQNRSIRSANDRLRALAASSAANAAEFQEAIASLADGLILWDRDDRIATWNRRCEELLPYAREVLRPGLGFEAYVTRSVALNHASWDAEARARRVAERLAQHRSRGGTGEFTTLDGRIIEIRETMTSSGGCVSVFRDMTEERRMLTRLTLSEAELQRALAAEREINSQQRQFVSMASHEFRTPLAIIDSASQRLLPLAAAMPGSDLPKRVDRIRSAVTRMVHIIDRTLSTARLDEGRVEFHPESCDLGAILREVCGRLRVIDKRIEIRLTIAGDAMTIDADPRLIDQIFTNLVANAVKYAGASTSVEVDATTTGDEAVVSVRDHGIGIPEHEIEHLFTRFYRASTALTIPGTGIGLHLVKQFVTMHGGSVSVRSAVQKGSTFTVRLPRRQPVAEAPRAVA
ncbi:MAG: PAS-domain containing protein [Alphaproteobacteria bacterium]|nr:PAS-domain containing protein [Alphaproteobacteria bacterium]